MIQPPPRPSRRVPFGSSGRAWARLGRWGLFAPVLWVLIGLPSAITHAQVETIPASADCATDNRLTPGYDRPSEGLPAIIWCHDADSVVQSFAHDESTIYVATESGSVDALDRGTGERRWSLDPGAALGALLVAGGQIITGNSAGVLAWTTNGEERWTAPMPDRVVSLAANDAGAIIAALPDGTAIALDPDTGAERWRTATAITDGTLIAGGGTVYLFNTPRALNFAVLDATDGTLRSAWILDTGPQSAFTTPVLHGSTLITGYDARPDGGWYGGVMAIDTVTGAVPWDIPTPAPVQIAPVLAPGTDGGGAMVQAISLDGHLYRIDPATGQSLAGQDILESRGVETGTDQLLTVAGETYYIGQGAAPPANNVSYHNVITATRAVGAADWRFRLGNPPALPVVVDAADVFIADGRSLFVLTPSASG